jgi:hypothetical protein
MTIAIGSAKFGNNDGGFKKQKTFYLNLDNGGNNIFRILPPMFSLAERGQYYKYWSLYQNMLDSNGKTRWFSSIEEFDVRSKTLRVADPVLEKLKEYKAKEDMLKQSGATEDQLAMFYNTYIKPFTPRKSYYVNVITQNNELGTLALPSKAFQQLKQLASEYNNKGIDITGMRGIFLNFKRVKTGARLADVSDSVDVFRESVNIGGELVEKPKIHELTSEIINRFATEIEDLATKFTIPSASDLEMLANAPLESRSLVVDRIVGKSTQVEAPKPTLNVSIPGTNAVAVPRVESTGNGNMNVVIPTMTAPQSLGVNVTAAQSTQAPSIGLSTKPASGTLSEEEFQKIFGKAAK